MDRTSTFGQLVRATERAAKQATRDRERSRLAAAREAERAGREAERRRRALDRDRARRERDPAAAAEMEYVAAREEEVERLNAELESRVKALSDIHFEFPPVPPLLFSDLYKEHSPSPFDATASVGPEPEAPKADAFRTRVTRPGTLARLLGKQGDYHATLEEARFRDDRELAAARHAHAAAHREWLDRVEIAMERHESEQAGLQRHLEAHNAEIDALRAQYEAGEAAAVCDYFKLALDRPDLPEEIPMELRVGYIGNSKQLVIERQLPSMDAVPTVDSFLYDEGRDRVCETERADSDREATFERLLSGCALLTFADVFSADTARVVEVVVVNGRMRSYLPTTGAEVNPYVLTARITRAEFARLSLTRLDPVLCLNSYGVVSRRLEALSPVRPILDFRALDERHAAGRNRAEESGSIQDVVDLSADEFEALLEDVLARMGLDPELDRSSRNGSIAGVAFDDRPLLGGKAVIQARQSTHTVDVAAVREVYGTMRDEGANKVILLTTSDYGPDAFEFARDKPIELIDGPGLVELLREQGVEARPITTRA